MGSARATRRARPVSVREKSDDQQRVADHHRGGALLSIAGDYDVGGRVFLINAIYLPLVEERGLERRFGEEYLAYKRQVPRIIPSLRGLRREASRRANSS